MVGSIFSDILFDENSTPIGPAITIKAIITDIRTGKVRYKFSYKKKTKYLKSVSSLKEIEAFTGLPIVSESKFRKYLAQQADLCKNREYV